MSQLTKPEPMDVFFNSRVSGYEDHMKENKLFEAEKMQLAEAFEATEKPVQILDLGCGTGLEIEYILQRVPNARFICVDFAVEMLKLLKLKYQSLLNQLEIVQASYLDYDFGRNWYDYVVAAATMHHWLPKTKLLLYQRIWESLKPGGRFINDDYMVPVDQENAALDHYLQLRECGLIEDGKFYHVDIPFSVGTERQILAEAGFRDVRVVYEHYGENHCHALIVGVKEVLVD
ncbi:MAG TPA: class I SAM-dependent methyltransferase [Bacillota bacterium]|nr:class I SAM-dependent methyltransferase [Bacillota bacterium]